jgi:DNA-binding NtrC family response regulator
MGRPAVSFNPQTMRALEAYHWPGNVRELENVVERTITLAESEIIGKKDLPPNICGNENDEDASGIICPRVTEQGVDMAQAVDELERCLIRSAMELANGVKARAAALLSIKRTTLVEKIKRLNLES